MKITFIGTSHGAPEIGRRCSSYMIEAAGRFYLIDMGTSSMESIISWGIKPADVKAIFITHPHGDHTHGLIQYADLIHWYYKDADTVMFVPNEQFKPAIYEWLKMNHTPLRDDVEFRVTEAGVIWDDGVVKVTAYPTKHCENSFAFLAECEGRTVLFTGDLRHPSADYPEEAKKLPLDLAVCETAHFSPKDFMPIWEESDVKRVIHTHVSPRWHADLDELSRMEHEFEFGVAKDGMVIEL